MCGDALEVRLMEKGFNLSNTIRWVGDKRYIVSSAGKPDIDIATPARFGGRDDLWSPLDLLIASVNACLLSAFVAVSERLGARFVSYESEASGHLEVSGGALKFTELVVRPTITVESESDVQKVERAIKAAEEHCPVARSLSVPIRVEPKINIR